MLLLPAKRLPSADSVIRNSFPNACHLNTYRPPEQVRVALSPLVAVAVLLVLTATLRPLDHSQLPAMRAQPTFGASGAAPLVFLGSTAAPGFRWPESD